MPENIIKTSKNLYTYFAQKPKGISSLGAGFDAAVSPLENAAESSRVAPKQTLKRGEIEAGQVWRMMPQPL